LEAEVIEECHDGILVLTINRPSVRNALNRTVARALASSLQRLDADPDLRVGVITGAEGQFSAGSDLKAGPDELPYVRDRGYAGLAEARPRKPLIAAVEGYAVGGGFEVALACDLIVASRDALFGLPEVKIGLIASGGGLIHLPRRIPHNIVSEWALTGRFVSATRAEALGIVNRIVDPGQALSASIDLAAEIAANGPAAVQATKEVLSFAADLPEETAWARQDGVVARIQASPDAEEGVRAFVEKRKPVWRRESSR
jgi:enoyl-CoA hydratase